MRGFDQVAGEKRYSLKPRFTTIYHPIRIELGLNTNEYSVIDSVDQLSHKPDHPWCTETKENIAKFLGIGERTVYRAIDTGLEKNLIEKDDRGALRSTLEWIETVRLYKEKTTPR